RTRINVRVGEAALRGGDLADRFLQRALLAAATIEDARFVEMNVALDQARHDQTAVELLAWRLAFQMRGQRGDAAFRDADVKRLAFAPGNARVPQDEVERHVRSAIVLLRRGPHMPLPSPDRPPP